MDTAAGRELCFKVVDMAKKAGVQQCDVILQRGKSLSLQAQQGKIDKTKVTSTQVLGIRVIQDQKIGIAASESLDDDALGLLVQQALGASRFSGVDPYQRIEQKNAEDFVVAPARLNCPDSAPIREKIDLALRLESEVLGRDKRCRNVPYSGYADGEGEHFYANHLGTYCYQSERSFSCYTSALTSGEGTQAMYTSSSISRDFAGLDLKHCVAEAADTAVQLLHAKAIPTGRYDVIFSTDEWENILGAFLGAFSGKAAMEGIGYYRDKVGKTVASREFTLLDSPQYAPGFSFSVFDDEGVAKRELALIENGKLETLLHNSATARFFKLASTGHASRGPRGSLGTSASQLLIKPGRTQKKDLYQGKVLKVIGLKGLHSGTNSVSGHFSLAIEALLLENGETKQYVKDVTLSGNFYQMLENIQAIGVELESSSGKSFFSPELRFANLSVAGS